MADLDKALATQLANIETRTGKTLAELGEVVASSGLTKHGELVAMLKSTLGMGHGDANTAVHVVRQSAAQTGAVGAPGGASGGASALDALYVGPKAALRPIHEAVLAAMEAFGPYEEAPKKAYVSYRRARQFAMVGPATNTRVEVGLNARGLSGGERLLALPAGQMCAYKVKLTRAEEVDAELVAWIQAAYDAAD